MKRRLLTAAEIKILKAQNCTAEDWGKIKVSENFSPDNIIATSFSGTIYLGAFKKKIKDSSGRYVQTGIYHASIHNCTIEDDVYIRNISGYIANYHIASNVYIENIYLSNKKYTNFTTIYCLKLSLFLIDKYINI